MINNEEFSIIFGKKEMKKFVKLSQSSSASVAINTITLDDSHYILEEESTPITTFDFKNDTHTNEIINIEVNEKRGRDEIRHHHNKS